MRWWGGAQVRAATGGGQPSRTIARRPRKTELRTCYVRMGVEERVPGRRGWGADATPRQRAGCQLAGEGCAWAGSC